MNSKIHNERGVPRLVSLNGSVGLADGRGRGHGVTIMGENYGKWYQTIPVHFTSGLRNAGYGKDCGRGESDGRGVG